MDINIPSGFVTAIATSTSENFAGFSGYAALILGLLVAFYFADVLVDVITSKHETSDTPTT